ncbi:MAG TPA: hemolysin family protein [Candidatus Limnocylindria bacterium]|nr:hemolysin family protein [Candidatus Limnocylindria bacterium]
MDFPLAVIIPLLLLLAAASFFFAAAESALFTLGPWRAKRLAESRPRRGEVVLRLLSRPTDLLATLVLGNSLANALFVALALMAALHSGWAMALLLLGLFVGLLLLCEVTPKALAVREPEDWALRVAVPLEWLVYLSRPVRRVGQAIVDVLLRGLIPKSIKPQAEVSDEEYADLVELAHQQGALGRSEKELILQILSLDQRTARDVMRPRAQMVMLPDDLPAEAMIAAARKAGHHRIPLYDESPDTVVAILNTRSLLLNPDGGLDEALEFPSFVPGSMNLLQLLQALQRQQRGVAIVLDEFGGTAGLVTLEDMVEAVVGPIRSEGEAPGFVMEKQAPGRWRVNGLMRLDDFRREYPALGEVDSVDTLGGLAVKLAEVVPPVGAVLKYRGLRLTVRSADDRRVRELLVETEGGAA